MFDEFDEYNDDEFNIEEIRDEFDELDLDPAPLWDDELDFFDKREVICYEVSKWDWVCESCGSVNTEHKKPRFEKFVRCSECDSTFSAICED